MSNWPGGAIGAGVSPTAAAGSGVWRSSQMSNLLRRAAMAQLWPVPDPSFSSVGLLCHFELETGTTGGFPNRGSTGGALVLAGGGSLPGINSMDTLGRKFLSYPAFRTAATSYLSSNTNAAYNYGAGDFTIEFWVFLNLNNDSSTLWDQRPVGTNGLYPNLHQTGTGDIAFFTNSADRITSTGGPLTTLTWHHVALSKVSGSTKLFVDGTQVGSTYTDGNTYLQGPIVIASSAFTLGSARPDCYYQELRSTKGVGRYSANFTPSTAPFPGV